MTRELANSKTTAARRLLKDAKRQHDAGFDSAAFERLWDAVTCLCDAIDEATEDPE